VNFKSKPPLIVAYLPIIFLFVLKHVDATCTYVRTPHVIDKKTKHERSSGAECLGIGLHDGVPA
jgi:hypothetical protein